MGGEWKEISLGEFVTLKRGYDLPHERRRAGSVPILGSSGITGWHNESRARGPGVTIGRSGALGVVNYSSVDFWPLNTALFVDDFHGNDERYAYYFLKTLDFTIFNSGSAQPSLNRNFIHPLRVIVPPIEDQRAIACILGTLDDKIALNRKMGETLEALARALFQSWFVDFDPVRAKTEGRDPRLPMEVADLFPDSLENSELGEIPRGWVTAPLGSVASTIETGKRPNGGVAGIHSGIPSIGAESIDGLGVFDYSKSKFVPIEFFSSMKSGRVSDHDVLLYKDGGRPGLFEPHTTLVGLGFPFATCAINEHVYRLRTDPAIPQSYLFFWLSSASVMEEMRTKGTGVAIPGLNSMQVRSLRMLIPPGSLLDAFDRFAAPLIARILRGARESRELSLLRDELLPRLVSGEVRVPGLGHTAAET